MTVLTVNINDKKDKEALKALKAIIEAFGLNYGVDLQSETADVSIPIAEWEEIQKRLNIENFYNEFEGSVKAISADINGTAPLKNARELLNDHRS